MQVPKRRSEAGRKHGPDDNHLSPEAISALKEDLRRLKERARPKAVEDLTRAREMGDLSENAAYTEAKARLRGIDGRIMAITKRLKYAIPIEKGPTADGRVRIGATVVVESNGRRKTYEIVGSQETDPGTGRISHLSPLGSLLMGKRSGDVVDLEAAGRTTRFHIETVS